MSLSGSRFAKTFLSYRLHRSLHVISQFIPPSYPGKEDLYVATQADITRRYFEASGEKAQLKLFSIDGVSENFLDHMSELSIEGIIQEPSVNIEKVVSVFNKLTENNLIKKKKKLHWVDSGDRRFTNSIVKKSTAVVSDGFGCKLQPYRYNYYLLDSDESIPVLNIFPEQMLTEGFLKVHSKNVKCGHLVGNKVVNLAGREVKLIADDTLDVNLDPFSIRANDAIEPFCPLESKITDEESDFFGMSKREFTEFIQEQGTPWTTLWKYHACPDTGECLRPQIGDAVLLSFNDSVRNISQPDGFLKIPSSNLYFTDEFISAACIYDANSVFAAEGKVIDLSRILDSTEKTKKPLSVSETAMKQIKLINENFEVLDESKEVCRWLMFTDLSNKYAEMSTNYTPMEPIEKLTKLQNQIKKVCKLIQKIDQNHGACQSDSKHLTGMDKLFMARFVQMTDNLHTSIRKNDFDSLTTELADFWFKSISWRNKGYKDYAIPLMTKPNDMSRAVFHQFTSVVDNYLRFLRLVLPSFADEMRTYLPKSVQKDDNLFPHETAKMVLKSLPVDYIEGSHEVARAVVSSVNNFVVHLESADKLEVHLHEYGSAIGSAMNEFPQIISRDATCKVKYTQLADHMFFEDMFSPYDGYLTSNEEACGHKFFLVINISGMEYLVPRQKNLIKKLNRNIEYAEMDIKKVRKRIATLEGTKKTETKAYKDCMKKHQKMMYEQEKWMIKKTKIQQIIHCIEDSSFA